MSGVKRTPADIAFADCLKEAHDHVCVVCGRQGRMEASHIHSRKHRTIRWCKENCLPKCHTCHRWWHGNPTESGIWFRNEYGEGMVEILLEKKRERVKVSKIEEKEIAKHYREQLKMIEQKRADGVTGYIDFVSWQ